MRIGIFQVCRLIFTSERNKRIIDIKKATRESCFFYMLIFSNYQLPPEPPPENPPPPKPPPKPPPPPPKPPPEEEPPPKPPRPKLLKMIISAKLVPPRLPELPPLFLFLEIKTRMIMKIIMIGKTGNPFSLLCARSPLYFPLKTSKSASVPLSNPL